ncbi:MAG: glycosyltransferase family 39 protein [Magnetococcales bacterium]|nr:glycosyltransferase family 39 protein [Magnetococcales bacterium]
MPYPRMIPIFLAATGFAVLIHALALLVFLPNAELQEWLITWTNPFLTGTLFLILLGLFLNLDAVRTLCKNMPRQVAWGLPLIFVAGTLYPALVAPQTHRIYYDENIYLNIAQNMTHLGRAQMCNSGGTEHGVYHCDRWEYNKQPNGFPFLASQMFRLVGVSETAGFLLNNLLLGLAAVTVFFLGRHVGGSWRAGTFAALAAIITPQNLHWYNSTAAEPGAAVSVAAVVLATFFHLHEKTTVSLLPLVALAAFALHFRPESILILPLVLLILLTGRSQTLFQPAFLVYLALFLLLALPVGLHMELFHNHPWGSSGKPYSLDYLALNLPVNGWHYFDNRKFPLLLTILALFGLFWPGKRWPDRLLIGVWFLLFWGVFIFFYAGSYTYGADIRYAVVSALPLAVLAGAGGDRITRLLERGPRLTGHKAVGLLGVVMFLSHLLHLPQVRATSYEAWAARADHRLARAMASRLPPESLVLTHNPNMFQLWGFDATQTYLLLADPNYYKMTLHPNHRGGVYFHFNFWCNVADPEQKRFCRQILDTFPHDLVEEHWIMDYRYALYRLRPPRSDALQSRQTTN